MCNIPMTLTYSHNHEWLRADGHGRYVVGITDHAQSLLGDIIFVHLPNLDEHVTAGENCAVTESLKAASDVCAPISGSIVAINESLEITPERVNDDPYGDGWLFVIQPKDKYELNSLLTAEAYQNFIEK